MEELSLPVRTTLSTTSRPFVFNCLLSFLILLYTKYYVSLCEPLNRLMFSYSTQNTLSNYLEKLKVAILVKWFCFLTASLLLLWWIYTFNESLLKFTSKFYFLHILMTLFTILQFNKSLVHLTNYWHNTSKYVLREPTYSCQ